MGYSDMMYDRDLDDYIAPIHLPRGWLPPENLNNLTSLNLLKKIDKTSPMSPEVFSAVRAGDRISNLVEKTKSDYTQLACLETDQRNSILHVAATSGHRYLVWDIINEHPNLLMKPNSLDELSLHVAASAGHLNVVEVIVMCIKHMSGNSSTRNMVDGIYWSKNRLGDTPLHAALKRKHKEVACCLVSADKSVSFLQNKENLSPLYLAVEAGYTELVKEMLDFPSSSTTTGSSTSSSSSLRFEGKSIIHAAMRAKNMDILDAILGKDPTLATSKNEEGRTCLSFGASIGYYEGVSYLLEKLPTSHVYISDVDGFFPIHMAAKNGHIEIIKKFLKLCPDSKELLTKQGQNIFHIAAKNGKAEVVKYLLKLDKKGRLTNEEDLDGNTPLHLATLYWHPKVASLLTWDPKVDLKTQNNDGYTALDVTEKKMDPGYILRERLTWMALISARAERGPKLMSSSGTMQKRRSFRQVDAGKYKDRVNTLLLVATLVATMTFAAGFTLPGGYNSSVPNVGMAILTFKVAFKVFLICNAIAMYSSVVTIVALI